MQLLQTPPREHIEGWPEQLTVFSNRVCVCVCVVVQPKHQRVSSHALTPLTGKKGRCQGHG